MTWLELIAKWAIHFDIDEDSPIPYCVTSLPIPYVVSP